jgi:predicted transcriptional regulator
MSEVETLGPLEKVIMDIMWQDRQATVRSVWQKLAAHRQIAYTTVMTIMSRLSEKNLLLREKNGKTFVYTLKNTKEETLRSIIQKTMRHFIDRFGDEAVATFIDEADRLAQKTQQQKK